MITDLASPFWRQKTSLFRRQGILNIIIITHAVHQHSLSSTQRTKLPPRQGSGLYNCSVGDYWKFRQHLDCNLVVECEDGRDETAHCPFSSPACHGWIAFRNKCYTFVSKHDIDRSMQPKHITHMKDLNVCGPLNASIGIVWSDKLFRIIEDRLMRASRKDTIAVSHGFSVGAIYVPSVYRRSAVAYDKSVIHGHLHDFVEFFYTGEEICLSAKIPRWASKGFGFKKLNSCSADVERDAICEFTVRDRDQYDREIIHFSKASPSFKDENISLIRCHNDELVHLFLSCYPHHVCDQQFLHLCAFSTNSASSVDTFKDTSQLLKPVPAFTCNDGATRLSYTLVCDFRHHCKDGSDETFCQHPSCDALACGNGQCVSYSKRCDSVSDCLDDSDELRCKNYALLVTRFANTTSPVRLDFDRTHSFQATSMRSNETCPETHYRCPGEYNDCLPVYTRCNGWYDCVDHEDEEACENMTCPGFYHCFNSSVCVHTDHLCDGWPHCPHQDDEWLCDMTCPAQCRCQGHTFVCSKPFPAHLFLYLRYLDAQGSKMTPFDLINNSYLTYLRLSDCHLKLVTNMTLPNLQFLDLSANNLTVIRIAAFSHLANLRTLSLSKNPIHLIHYDPDSAVQMNALHTIGLSHTKLTVFDGKAFSNMINLQRFNLSYCDIHTILSTGFRYTSKLTHLYLAGNPITKFPLDLFKPLKSLRVVSLQTYTLCCRKILPDHFEIIQCEAPRDEISSCEDLLQSGTYRAFLWLISFLSLFGNMFCLVARVFVQRTASTNGFHVFVTNLGIADLLMGVYMAIIGMADSLFRGEYLSSEETWKHSVACKVAGFLSLLSCEVSALTIWLITLDRFIVLHFPFSSVRFQKTSATAACLTTWLIGLLLALTPLLPVTSHWEFYSQTGICIPLPVTRQNFKGKSFSIGVFIVFNFILFALIASGQAFIYWSVQKNAFETAATKASRDLTIARRLISVAVTDFLCWFPIGLCGLLALADIPIPGEVNVAFAIFVLPLNSALNPFMYTFNMLMERRRKSREAMMLQWLENHSDLLR